MTTDPASLSIGTWNLQQARPARSALQHESMHEMDLDLWLLTEVRDDALLPHEHAVRSPAQDVGSTMRWAAVCSRWPVEERPSGQAGLALAVVHAPGGGLLTASSVMPWRGAKAHWPGDADAPLADRFRDSLREHRTAIEESRDGRPVVWGGDVNLALEGPEHAGATATRADLLQAFADVGLEARTGHLPHRIADISTIDHVAVPTSWQVQTAERHEPGLSDHALYLVRAMRV